MKPEDRERFTKWHEEIQSNFIFNFQLEIVNITVMM